VDNGKGKMLFLEQYDFGRRRREVCHSQNEPRTGEQALGGVAYQDSGVEDDHVLCDKCLAKCRGAKRPENAERAKTGYASMNDAWPAAYGMRSKRDTRGRRKGSRG
jgi:hypothetical protein